MSYRNVKASQPDLDAMLALTRGERRVPVMLEDGKVTIGYGGT